MDEERSPTPGSEVGPADRTVVARPRTEEEPGRNGAIDSLVGATGRVVAPFARVGYRGARGVARRLGVGRALDRAAGRGVDRALDGDSAAEATQRVLETDTAKRVWAKVLESDEAQQLIERVAAAPELRAAIAAQGVGLLHDLRRRIRRVAREADTVVERIARAILRRQRREGRPIYAGACSRLLAMVIDFGIIYGSLLLLSAAIALIVAIFSSGDQDAGTVVIAVGAFLWLLIAALYLVVFWAGADRTPGMSFLALRLIPEEGDDITLPQAIRRLVWFAVSALLLGLGFLGVLFNSERRGWPDRRAKTYLCYSDPDLDKDLV